MGAMMGAGRGPIKARGAAGGLAALVAAAAAAAPPPAAPALRAGAPTPGGGRLALLDFGLSPGWKTYWRAPGDAGVPPAFDWSGSDNLASVVVEWPAPEVFDSFGFTTLGYAAPAVLPLRLTPADPALPVRLRLTLDYGVCAELCVADRVDLALDIAPEAAVEGGGALAAAMARLPVPAAEAGLVAAECGLAGAGAERSFAARLRFAGPAGVPELAVVEGPEGVWFGPATAAAAGDVLTVAATAQLADPGLWVGRDALRITLLGPGFGAAGAAEVAGCAAPPG